MATSLFLDFRHAARMFGRNMNATTVPVLTLALAIGATTAIFSVVYGVMLRPLPYPESDRVMAVWEISNRGIYTRLADPNFSDFRDRNRTFSAIAKYTQSVVSVSGADEPTRSVLAAVTKDFFTVLGVQPTMGRGFTADDARAGADPAVVVSHRYWTQSMGSSPIAEAHAYSLRIRNRVHTVIGVMPAGFEFPTKTDLWVPAELDSPGRSRTAHNFSAIGRLRSDVSLAQASADISRIAQTIVRDSSEKGSYLMRDAAVVPLQTSLTRRVGSTLYVLLGAVFFLLLVACANVTNLLLAKAMARRRELAVRHALGAGRARLIRQFVLEALIMLTLSGIAGLVIAAFGIRGLLAVAPADLPRLDEVSMNWTVMSFAMALSSLVAIVLGVVTAARATRRDPRTALADSARGQIGTSSQRFGQIVVAMQTATTVVLLIGAVLLGRSLLRVLSVDPGFRTSGIMTMDLALPRSDDPAAKVRLIALYASILDRLAANPTVKDVAVANAVPLTGGLPDGQFRTGQNQVGIADYASVSAEYFRALDIPLIRGRLFGDRDGEVAPHVAVISESLARSQWRDSDPIGATIEFGNMDGDRRPISIVGIVGDTHEYGLERPPRPTVYVNQMQRPSFTTTIVMRSDADSGALVSAARAVIKNVAPEVAPRFRAFDEIYAASLGARRFNLMLVAVFAGTALILAITGIYGVMAYAVTQRRRELSVRVALGATSAQLLRKILGQGLTTTATGMIAGVVGALALTRTMESLLFGVKPTDSSTFAIVIVTLTLFAAAACVLPARRAINADPAVALRQD